MAKLNDVYKTGDEPVINKIKFKSEIDLIKYIYGFYPLGVFGGDVLSDENVRRSMIKKNQIINKAR